MQGKEITRCVLVPNSETIISYDSPQQHADLVNYGPGDIFISWRQSALLNDVNCLKLTESQSYELRPKSPWNMLSIIGAQASEVQVVVR